MQLNENTRVAFRFLSGNGQGSHLVDNQWNAPTICILHQYV